MQLRGFTLIELVIYMAILGMLGAGVFSAYTFFLKHQIRARQIAELRFASDDASRHFHEYLGGADKITIRGSGHHICAIATHHEFIERTGLTLTSAEKLTARSFGGVGGRTSRSLSFWIRASGRTSPQTIIDSGTDQPGRRWQVMTDAEGRIMLDISGSSIRGGSRIRDGNWHHVMLVFNAERTSRLTPVSLTIYINGEPEGLTQAPGTPIIVDTDASVPMSLGGSRTNTSFTGSLAAVKLWEKALDPASVSPELHSAAAVDRDGLVLELTLGTGIDDTSEAAHILTGPPNLSFATHHRSYSKKTSFRFAPENAGSPFHQLWQKTEWTGLRQPSPGQCELPDPDRGWSLSGKQRWHLRQEPTFALSNGILEVRADIADRIAGPITSLSHTTRIVTHSGDTPDILCRISPHISGYKTGDEQMAQAVIRIDPDDLEPDGDTLFFEADVAQRQGPLSRITGGRPQAYFSYKNISASGTEIWRNITAEYVPDTGIMTICSTTETHCGNADMLTRHGFDAWSDVFGQVRYASGNMTYVPRKRFVFTLTNGTPPAPGDILSLETDISPGAFFTLCP